MYVVYINYWLATSLSFLAIANVFKIDIKSRLKIQMAFPFDQMCIALGHTILSSFKFKKKTDSLLWQM